LRGVLVPWNKGKGTKTPENKRIKNSIEYSLWRKSVYERDDYTCQKCMGRGIKLHPHHIKNFSEFPELRFSVSNGITFCVKHHIRFHKVFGRRHNNEIQVSKYLKKHLTKQKFVGRLIVTQRRTK